MLGTFKHQVILWTFKHWVLPFMVLRGVIVDRPNIRRSLKWVIFGLFTQIWVRILFIEDFYFIQVLSRILFNSYLILLICIKRQILIESRLIFFNKRYFFIKSFELSIMILKSWDQVLLFRFGMSTWYSINLLFLKMVGVQMFQLDLLLQKLWVQIFPSMHLSLD